MSGLHLDEKLGVPLFVGVAVFVAFLFLTPASFWFKVDRLDVQDAATWQDITIDYARTINRDFEGQWRATVRQETAEGWQLVCSTQWQPQDYQTDAVLPDPVTLQWLVWTEPDCYQLGQGRYEVRVTWDINPGSWIFGRKVTRTDTFMIFGAS